ncbi:hypothetical protein BH18ACT9_BH18ACT9_02160 [soil metagenome]
MMPMPMVWVVVSLAILLLLVVAGFYVVIRVVGSREVSKDHPEQDTESQQ